jgi:exodeoxyribonuclease VII small subunit
MLFLEEKKFDFEENLKELEGIVKKMENSEISLDESVEAFQKGMKLTTKLHKRLDEVEGKIQKLIIDSNGETKLIEDI